MGNGGRRNKQQDLLQFVWPPQDQSDNYSGDTGALPRAPYLEYEI